MTQSAIWGPASRPAPAALAAEQAQLARLRRQVDERWRALALAQERAELSMTALERLYDSYMRAVDTYVLRQRALTRPREARRLAS